MKKIWHSLALALSSILLAALSMPAEASYFIAPVTSKSLNPALRTHVVVVGRGNDLGTLPQKSGAAKVQKLLDIYPGEQVLFIAVSENSYNEATLRKMGFENVQHVDSLLNSKRLMDELSPYTQIASMHVYGHGAISEGVFLDTEPGGHDVRWYPTDTQPARLIGHFTSDAFVTLNGCNLGHVMAPTLAKTWGLPVSGSLTGTDFEYLMNDGNFYHMDSGDSTSPMAQTSLSTLSKLSSCAGGCIRMRPDDAPYNGHYGIYHQGLPFYKFFCVGIDQTKCLTGMAHSMIATVSTQALSKASSLAQYSAAVRDWLCPSHLWNSTTQKDCMEKLAAINPAQLTSTSPLRTYTGFSVAFDKDGIQKPRTAQCNFSTCYPDPKCMIPANTLQCAWNLPAPAQATTMFDEYISYLKGYQLLTGSTDANLRFSF